MTETLVDLPQFGTVEDYRAALAELETMPTSPEVIEAIAQCHREIALAEGRPVPSLDERMTFSDLIFVVQD